MSTNNESESGAKVGIYVLGPKDHALPRALKRSGSTSVTEFGGTALCASIGVDFAKSAWPIVVKVKAIVSRKELSQSLRDLADAVDRGMFIQLQPDCIPNQQPMASGKQGSNVAAPFDPTLNLQDEIDPKNH